MALPGRIRLQTPKVFSNTSITPSDCDARASELTGGIPVVPVYVQGNSSYSVYAGSKLRQVVQFRIPSTQSEIRTSISPDEVYGPIAPTSRYEGMLGPFEVFVERRIYGIDYFEFLMSSEYSDNSIENKHFRTVIVMDLARCELLFFEDMAILTPAQVPCHLVEQICPD